MRILKSKLEISYQLRLILSFFSLVAVIFIWLFTYLIIDQKQKDLRDFSDGLTHIQIQYLKSSTYLQKFMLTGFHDPLFYKTGNQENVDSFIRLQRKIINNITDLKASEAKGQINVH